MLSGRGARDLDVARRGRGRAAVRRHGRRRCSAGGEVVVSLGLVVVPVGASGVAGTVVSTGSVGGLLLSTGSGVGVVFSMVTGGVAAPAWARTWWCPAAWWPGP